MSCISYSFSWHSRLEARFMWLTFWGLGNTCWKATEPHGSQQVRTETVPVAWLGIFLCISVIIELPPHARHSHYWIVTWQMSVWLTALTGWFPSKSPSSIKLWRLHLSCEFSCVQAFICSFSSWHFMTLKAVSVYIIRGERRVHASCTTQASSVISVSRLVFCFFMT